MRSGDTRIIRQREPWTITSFDCGKNSNRIPRIRASSSPFTARDTNSPRAIWRPHRRNNGTIREFYDATSPADGASDRESSDHLHPNRYDSVHRAAHGALGN